MIDQKDCERITRGRKWVATISMLIYQQVMFLNTIMLIELVDVVREQIWPIKVYMAILWAAWSFIMSFMSYLAGNVMYEQFLEGKIFKEAGADDKATD